MKQVYFGIRYLYHWLFSGFHHLGWPVAFGGNVTVRKTHHIWLGNHVFLDSNVVIQLPEEHKEAGCKQKQIKLKIDDGVSIGLGTMISAAESITIEKNVLIGQYCFIGDHDHAYQDVTRPIRDQGLTNIEPVLMKEGSWIGANVTVCSGVTIGKNSTIGANSVVTRNIPDYSVAVGVPARVIKRYSFRTNEWKRVTSK